MLPSLVASSAVSVGDLTTVTPPPSSLRLAVVHQEPPVLGESPQEAPEV
jgi:hypothetical protein